MSTNPKLIVIAGCNGAGKSTLAPHLLRVTFSGNSLLVADQQEGAPPQIYEAVLWEKICEQNPQ
jgi:ABC-type Mn2+/Zn2+ transport system ATPase subunit